MMYRINGEDKNPKLTYKFSLKDVTNVTIHSSPLNKIEYLAINNQYSSYNENDGSDYYCDYNEMKIIPIIIISFFRLFYSLVYP